MQPLLSLTVPGRKTTYVPGDLLCCQYQVDAVDPAEVTALEASILWQTDGKGDSDLGVHYFERKTPGDFDGDLRSMHELTTTLPNSPLTYDGVILQIRWCIRIRLFLKRGKAVTEESRFVLAAER